MNANDLQPLPHDAEAEQVTLGAMALDTTARNVAAEILDATDFYMPKHRILFTAIIDLAASGDVDLVLLSAALKQRGELEKIGGNDYLFELVEGTPSTANARHYAQLVKDKARLRRLIALCCEAERASYAGLATADELGGKLLQDLYGLATKQDNATMTLAAAEGEALAHAEAVHTGNIPPGLMAGYAALDKPIGGFQPGELIVLAAGTGVGKTALACNISEHIAADGGPVLYVTREMGPRELGKRFLQARSGVAGQRIKLGDLDTDAWTALHEARAASEPYAVTLDTRSGTVAAIAMRARACAAGYGRPLALIVVDYLQLLSPPADVAREHSARKVGEIARRLKLLAVDLGTPILLLSQLNRESARDGRPPKLHQLRESGEIEQHSDVVILLHRPDEGDGDTGIAPQVWAQVAKARDGMTTPWEGPGQVRLTWRAEITRFD